MTGRSLRAVLVAGLAFSALAASASAQKPTQAQTNAIKQSCRADYQARCSSVPTGGAAALNCLQGHLADLSPGCQTAVSAVGGGAASGSQPGMSAPNQSPPAAGGTEPDRRQEAAMLRRACGSDFRAYCRGVPLGGGAALGCLKDNASRLLPQCKGALAQAHGG
jgi:Cysteine rich repeat